MALRRNDKTRGSAASHSPGHGRTKAEASPGTAVENGRAHVGRQAANPVASWWRDVAGWFAFVRRRRPDTRFPVIPDFGTMVEFAAVFGSVLALLLLYADAPFLAVVREESWEPRGFFEVLTDLGDASWVLYPAGLVIIVYSLFRPGGMVARSRHLAHSLFLFAYFMFTTTAFTGILVNVLKALFGRARPEFVTAGIWESMPFGDHYAYASFPSGHATTAGAIAAGLALAFPRVRIFFLTAGVWTAISRPGLGVHFPSDVFAGFVFGGAFTYLYARSFARKRLFFAFDDRGRVVPRYRLPGRGGNNSA